MEVKKLKLINKAFDSLYDVVSRTGLFKDELDSIEDKMKGKGYAYSINGYDKCVFKKIKEEKNGK